MRKPKSKMQAEKDKVKATSARTGRIETTSAREQENHQTTTEKRGGTIYLS